MNKKMSRISLFLVLGVLFLTAMACKQAGEIVPDSVATERAIPTATSTPNMQEVVGADFEEGDKVSFIGKGYLIPFYGNPGDTLVLSHAARGDEGVVIGAALYEDVIWFEVESVAGTGWITGEFLEHIE